MTWEEAVSFIRTKPEFKELVALAYFEEDLVLNVERFCKSDEFSETLALLRQYAPGAKRILDVGSGNGISAIAFALQGYQVTVAEPDPSNTVGAGAIRKLKEHYGIVNMDIYEDFAERINLEKGLFDVVYVRQAMHHAYDLNEFIKNLTGLIKPGGYLMTIRDHVIFNEQDKQWFLDTHPLHKFYGGENAFTFEEYSAAMQGAGLSILKVFRHYESVINYFPTQPAEVASRGDREARQRIRESLGFLSKVIPARIWLAFRQRHALPDEALVPGRMYSFIAQKNNP